MDEWGARTTSVRASFALVAVAACGGSSATVGPSVIPTGVFSPGDALGYVVRDAEGRVVGRLHCRYLEDGELRTVVSRAVYGRPALDVERLEPERSVERATTFGPGLAVKRLKLLSSVEGLRTYEYENQSVVQVSPSATKRRPDPNPTAVPLHRDDPGLLALLVHEAGLRPGESARLAVRVDGAVEPSDWPVQVFANSERATVVRVPWGEATLDVRGRIDRMLMKNGLRYERVRPPGEPPPLLAPPEPLTYVRPSDARWIDRSVRVEVQRGVLAGALSVPNDRPASGAPGVVFFSDRGPQDRHGFGRGIDAGTWSLLDRLANEGFVVLRLDDRGAGASTASSGGRGQALDDARRIVEFMTRQPEVHPETIFVIGHGRGAQEAVSVAEDRAVKGLALLAPRARAGGGWLLKRAAGLQRPVAVFQGMRDFEVSWRADARALVEAVNGRRGKRAKLFVYEDVDHLMKTENRRSSPARYKDRTRRWSPRVLDDLVEWLRVTTSHRPV